MNEISWLVSLTLFSISAGSSSVRVPRQSSSNTDAGQFQTEPRRAVVAPGESITLLGNAGSPLQECHFTLPSGSSLDFSRGPESRSTQKYEYFGRGLDSGECGLRIKMADEADDGLVECSVRLEADDKWESAVTTLRVTIITVSHLPVFDIEPRRATISRGDNITITCNTDREIALCRFYLPGGRSFDLDRGRDSPAVRGAQYHGAGLAYGECGITLAKVDHTLEGYVVCKVGRGPLSAAGAWETDALKVTVTDDSNTSHNTGTTRRPQQTSRTRTTPSTDVRGSSRSRKPSESNSITPTPSTADRQGSGGGRCGRVKLAPAALITSAQHTEQGQWPWHVALYQNKGKNLNYICGGSLVTRNVVLTAAHCVTQRPSERLVNTESLVLYFGKYRRLVWSEGGVQNKQIERVHVHPTYNGTTLRGDLAVIILKSPVDYTDSVRHVCLWDPDKTGLQEVIGKEGTVVGWGYDESGESPPELMMARMPVVDQHTCIWSHQEFFSQFTSNTTLCAGFRNGTSVCNGDSGGGLVFPTKQRDNSLEWHLRALVSLSAPKGATRICDPLHYVVFTDVAQYLSWISPFIS